MSWWRQADLVLFESLEHGILRLDFHSHLFQPLVLRILVSVEVLAECLKQGKDQKATFCHEGPSNRLFRDVPEFALRLLASARPPLPSMHPTAADCVEVNLRSPNEAQRSLRVFVHAFLLDSW